MHTLFYAIFFTLIGTMGISASTPSKHKENNYPGYFQGVLATLVTPYKDNAQKSIDWAAYEKLVEHVSKSNVSAIVAVSPIGQWSKISLGEQEKLIITTLNTVKGCLPVLAGVSGRINFIQILELIKTAERAGASGILVTIPSFIKTDNVLQNYFHKICTFTSAKTAVVIDDSLGVLTPKNLNLLLSRYQNIKAVKISPLKNSSYISQMAAVAGKKCAILIGEEIAIDQAFRHGAVGVLTPGADIYPELLNSLVSACLKHDWEKAEQLQVKATLSWKFLNSFGNLGPTIKIILNSLIGIHMYPADRGTSYSEIHFSDNEINFISSLKNHNYGE